MKVTIDRFEGNFAVCETEDRTMINIARDRIPEGALEGYILEIHGDNSITIDQSGTEAKIKKAAETVDTLWE